MQRWDARTAWLLGGIESDASKVGIGTSTPSTQLAVQGGVDSTAVLLEWIATRLCLYINEQLLVRHGSNGHHREYVGRHFAGEYRDRTALAHELDDAGERDIGWQYGRRILGYGIYNNRVST